MFSLKNIFLEGKKTDSRENKCQRTKIQAGLIFKIFPFLFIIKKKQIIRQKVVRTSTTSIGLFNNNNAYCWTHITAGHNTCLKFLGSVDLGEKEKPPGDYLDPLKLNIKGNVRRNGEIL